MAIYGIGGIKTEFKNMEELVLKVLEDKPMSRDNDLYLYICCCVLLGANTIPKILQLNLNMMTCHRVRRQIQNDKGMYLPSEDIRRVRNEREMDINIFFKQSEREHNDRWYYN